MGRVKAFLGKHSFSCIRLLIAASATCCILAGIQLAGYQANGLDAVVLGVLGYLLVRILTS